MKVCGNFANIPLAHCVLVPDLVEVGLISVSEVDAEDVVRPNASISICGSVAAAAAEGGGASAKTSMRKRKRAKDATSLGKRTRKEKTTKAKRAKRATH